MTIPLYIENSTIRNFSLGEAMRNVISNLYLVSDDAEIDIYVRINGDIRTITVTRANKS